MHALRSNPVASAIKTDGGDGETGGSRGNKGEDENDTMVDDGYFDQASRNSTTLM